MNIKLKITLIIIVTLVIGIVIGAMVNRTLSQNRIRNIISSRRPDFFISFYEKIIEPDAAQSELIREILIKHAKHISDIRTNFFDEMSSSFESLKAELDPILTAEQKEHLKRRFPGRPSFLNRHQRKIGVAEELSALKEALGLSEDQISQVKHILEEWRDQGVMMRGRRGYLREKIQTKKEQEEKKAAAIEKILTEEQKKLYQQIKKDWQKKIEEQRRKRHGQMG